STLRRSPRSTLFPYTTLFRSAGRKAQLSGSKIRSGVILFFKLSRGPDRYTGQSQSHFVLLQFIARLCRPAENFARGSGFDFSSGDRKSTRLNSSHVKISYAVF